MLVDEAVIQRDVAAPTRTFWVVHLERDGEVQAVVRVDIRANHRRIIAHACVNLKRPRASSRDAFVLAHDVIDEHNILFDHLDGRADVTQLKDSTHTTVYLDVCRTQIAIQYVASTNDVVRRNSFN